VNPLRRTPWVTYGLVAANVAVLLLTPASRASVTGPSAQAQLCSQQAFYDHYAAIPRELTTGHQLAQVATGQPGPSQDTCYVSRPAYRKEPALSVLFSMFLHAGWLHLLGNMLFLVVFGNNIEDRFRKLPYLLFYLLCGYVAAYGFAFAGRWSRSCSSSRCASRRGWCWAAGSSFSGCTRPATPPAARVRWPT